VLYPQWSECKTIGAYKIDGKYTFSTPQTHSRGNQSVNRWSVDNVCKLLGGHVASTKDMGITTINYYTSVDYIQHIDEFKKEARWYDFWLRDISPNDDNYSPYTFGINNGTNNYIASFEGIKFTSGRDFLCVDTRISSCLTGMIEHNGVCTYPCATGYLINDDDQGACTLCDTANGYVSNGLGQCVSSSSLQSCSSYNDCSSGQFCVFPENTQMATTNCPGKPSTGTCRTAPSSYSITINNTTYTHTMNPYNYWSMRDFCQSKGKTMVTSSELLGIYSTWNQMNHNDTALAALVNNWTQDAFVRTDNDDDYTGIADSISGNVATSADGQMTYCLTNIATTVCK
jgi:hypothetical protein